MATSPAVLTHPDNPHERWAFFRDVLVFQLKMAVDNLRDLALIPVSLVAAVLDIGFKGKRQGALFYKVLEWGAHSEKMIDVYSALERIEVQRQLSPEMPSSALRTSPNFTIDAAIARLESVLLREYEKGGTAASIKSAMDRALDQLQTETGETRDKALGVVTRATDKLRSTLERENPNDV
jgi:hypothetical protein